MTVPVNKVQRGPSLGVLVRTLDWLMVQPVAMSDGPVPTAGSDDHIRAAEEALRQLHFGAESAEVADTSETTVAELMRQAVLAGLRIEVTVFPDYVLVQKRK